MGGLGKTTLARQIYHDTDIASHFDILAWVTVSRIYYEQEVLSRLLSSIRVPIHESSQESVEKLAEKLCKSLKGKRCLIVLDDVWDGDIVLKVKSLLLHDSNGSRILLTTRSHDVALYADPIFHIHRMRLQTDQEGWNLLHYLVFDKEMCPPELEIFGREIARICRGLPLALILIGGVLYKAERTRDYWMYVENELEKLGREIATQYMRHDLRLLNFVREWTYSGEIKTCCIHDVLRDFCQMKTKEEFNPDVVHDNFGRVKTMEKFNSDVENLLEVHYNLRHDIGNNGIQVVLKDKDTKVSS
ncbi:unnamed protein product [Fraxinus pennsylvanica]|uniref:NB-ARC domain-containing protein n=1 Tax=Fraxinus pennsylvanica TaxID=56036 RepID=A0AAD2DJX9_9LAMI|nr:unnamed protein product [Fraxinus pennsylvanica]